MSSFGPDHEPPLNARCLACGSHNVQRSPAEATRIRLEPATALLRCRNCRFGWVDRELLSSHAYDKEYFEQDFAGGVEQLPEHLHRRLDDMARLQQTGKLLEIGCGHGTFIAAALTRGWQVDGADISPVSAEKVRQRTGVQPHLGALENLPLKPGSYDVVHMNHVLEHLPQPLVTLQRVRELLRPGGSAWIEVPNELDALYDRLRWQLLRRWDARPTRSSHLYFFNPAALRSVVEQAGLRVESLITARRNQQAAASRFPLGRVVKGLAYALENRWRQGPNLIVVATRVDGNVQQADGR